MKRVLSIVLALSLIAGLLTGLTLTASAETVVSDIAITGVTAPVVGQEATTAGISTSAAYTQDISWVVWENGGYRGLNAGETFANGKVYRLDIILFTNDGYSFAAEHELTASVNGNPVTDFYSDCDWARFELLYVMDGVTVLDEVTIGNLPAVAAGTSTDLSGITGDANCTILARWYKETYNSQEDYWGWEEYLGTTLENGANYRLELIIQPKDGYWINKNTQLKVNGEVRPYWTYSDNCNCQCQVSYDFRPVVSHIDLTAAGAPAFGTALSAVTVTAPAGVNYTITPTWKMREPSNGTYTPVTGNFGYGEYRLEVEIIPNSGYTILDNATPTINGQPYHDHYDFGYWREDDIDGNRENGFTLICSDIYIDPANGYISDADLTGAPANITAGSTMPTPTITTTDNRYTVTGTKWLANDMAPVSGKFEANKAYYLEVSLAAKAGYAFDGWLDAYMNDEEADGFDVAVDRTTAKVYVYYTLKPVIEKVELTVTEPKIGAAPGAVTLPNGAKFVFDSHPQEDFPGYAWYIDGGQQFAKFENGEKYFVDIYLLPADGYEFSNNVEVTINGVKVEDGYIWCSGSQLNVWHSWSFREIIKNVNITLPNYKVGDVFKQDDVTLPAGVGCEIHYVDMYGNYTDPYIAIGKDRYRLNVGLSAKDGYEFAEDCVITVNGKALDEVYGDETNQDVYYEFSLCEQITKVEFPAYPTMQVGGTAEFKALTPPAGANYSICSDWYDADQNPYNGTLESNKAYYMQYVANPQPGYEFSEDCVVTVGGQVANTPIMRVDYDMAVVAKLYNFGMPTVDKVELTISAPVAGQKPAVKVTLPNGVHYIAGDLGWYESKSGDETGSDWDFMSRRDTFSHDRYYFAIAGIELEDGYVFAEDAKLIVNGKTVETRIDQYSSYLMGNYGQIVFKFDNLINDNPKTGITGIGIVTAMMALSATAAGVIISKKKEF